MKYKFKITFLVYFAVCLNLYTEDIKNTADNNAQQLMNSLNPNGHSMNSEGSLDGVFNVTNTSLNATYSIPLSTEQYNGSSLNFSLHYNGGLEHKANLGANTARSGFEYKSYSKKIPTWYLSVNNFVVQAFVENRSMFFDPNMYSKHRYDGGYLHTDPQDPNKKEYIFSNKDFNFSIKGYHYNNLIEPYYSLNGGEEFYPAPTRHDKIHFLRADGSLLTLINDSHEGGDKRNGIYLEYGANSNGYAVVDYIDEPSIECYLLWQLDDMRRRRVKYYPGDGLEYVFDEYISPYGVDILDSISPGKLNVTLQGVNPNLTVDNHNLGFKYNPTIFYLSEIYNDNQRIAKFNYDRHHPYENPICSDQSFGRAQLINFNDNWIDYSEGEVNIKSPNRTTKLHFRNQTSADKFSNLNVFGGNIEHWKPKNQEVNLFTPSNGIGYLNDVSFLNNTSLKLAHGEYVPPVYYEHRFDSEDSYSLNHFYVVKYLDYMIIKEKKDSVEEASEFLEKKIMFDYEEVIKKVDLKTFSNIFIQKNHPVLPYVGFIGGSYHNDLFGSYGNYIFIPSNKLEDILRSSIQLRDLRLKKIYEPSKIVELEYYQSRPNNSNVNEILYDKLLDGDYDESFYFNNNAVEKVNYSYIDDIYNKDVTPNLYLRETNNLFLSSNSNYTSYISECNAVALVTGQGMKNLKKIEYFNPKTNTKYLTVDMLYEYAKFSPESGIEAVVEKSSMLPTYESVTYTSNNSAFNSYSTDKHIGYQNICYNGINSTNLIKPYFTKSSITENGSTKTTNLEFYKYEVSSLLEGFKETSNSSFSGVLTKETKYICPPIISIPYENYFADINQNYILKQVTEFKNYKREELNSININGQFYENESATLERFYDATLLDGVDNYNNSQYLKNEGQPNQNIVGKYDNNEGVKHINKKDNQVQDILYQTSSDEFTLEYYLCYLLTYYKNFPGLYSQNYGNNFAVIKPKFGITKSIKLFKFGINGDTLLNGVNYTLEDDAYNGSHFTYAQGKVIEEKIIESELYGGSRYDNITSKLIEYSVGAQGGGFPSKIISPNGSLIQNYYVYNNSLHYNRTGTSNPVYTVQDYWDKNLVDTEDFPCYNVDYFTPAAYVVKSNNIRELDKLIESKNIFQRSKPVSTQNFVRKFKPDGTNINYFNKFTHDNLPLIVNESTQPPNQSGSFDIVETNEILSLNKLYEYDGDGRLTGEVDANNYITRYSYDNFDRIKQINSPYDYNSTNVLTNNTDRLAIDAVTMTKEADKLFTYQVKTIGECEHRLADIIEINNSEKIYFNKFEVGGEAFAFIMKSISCDGFDNLEEYNIKKKFAEAPFTFRIPKRIETVNSITSAFISLNIKDIPVIKPIPGEEDFKDIFNNKNEIIFYISFPQLKQTDGRIIERKIIISEDNYIVQTDPDQLNYQWGINQKNGKIIIDLKDCIKKDGNGNADFSDLITLFNTPEPTTYSDSDVKSTKLMVNISPNSIQVPNESFYNLERFRGIVEFYDNTADAALRPVLVLKGDFKQLSLKARDYFLENEFTMKNNYGNFGDYVNSYRKIDNAPPFGSKLNNINFFNNFAQTGYNYNAKETRIYNNNSANGEAYLIKPIIPYSNTISQNSSVISFDNKALETDQVVHDKDKLFVTNLNTQNKYNGTGELIQTRLNDGTTLDIEYQYSNASEFITDYPDINFYGLSKKVKTIRHNGVTDIADLDVYDLFGNMVLSFKNITNPNTNWTPTTGQYSKLVKYYFDLNKNIRKVSELLSNGQFRDIHYWYDEFGRVKHTYHPDFGNTHFSYDNSGNLRFKQDEKQFEDDRITYYEYDDLNRLLITGDAKLDPMLFGGGFDPSVNFTGNRESTIFNTMLDVKDVYGVYKVNPNILNDGNVSMVNGNHVLTSNKTLLLDKNYDCYISDGIINDTVYSINSVPLLADKANDILGTNYNFPSRGIVHKNYIYKDAIYPNNTNNGASPNNFENIQWYSNFVRRMNFYDELPQRVGLFLKYMPKTEFIDYLSYDNGILNDDTTSLYNIKGRLAVQAYRDYENQPFNFIYYSYDARGRIESLIRFTENLGFDCIYYKYNSLDKITGMVVVGPRETIKTAYAYDGYGRLEKVYSSANSMGHSLYSETGTNFLTGLPPSSNLSITFLNPSGSNPDILYKYDSDNKIASTTYSPISANIRINNTYESSLRMLEQIIATDNSNNTLFSETLGYDLLQRINEVDNVHFVNGISVHSESLDYTYDNLNQLVNWTNNMTPMEHFSYDALGNRTSSINFPDAPDMITSYQYVINDPTKTRLLVAQQNNKWINKYDYFSNGQLKEREKVKKVVNAQPGGADAIWKHTIENFNYNSFGLLRDYKFNNYYASYDCEMPFNDVDAVVWRYGYNPFNERESKKMVKSPDGDRNGNTYAMMYYLLDEKNRQHINYVGMQSSDAILQAYNLPNSSQLINVPNKFPDYFWPTCYWPNTPPSKSEQVLIYSAQMNVYGGGSSPLISYKVNKNTGNWQKHFNIYDHLGTLQQTYINTGFNLTPTSMQTQKPFGGDNWSNTTLTTKESTLLNWIGKEKDNESNLGDHGVRKYEYETGRFISIDPLWGKYFGWTPYQYSMNSPVMLVDIDGEIVRDDEGKIVFEEVELANNEHPGDRSHRSNRSMRGYIFADDGTKIEAYKNLSSDKRFDTNCHGVTFADGGYWVNDDQVNKIIKGDGYSWRNNSDDITESDVVIFYDYPNNNFESVLMQPVHSETVSKVTSKDILLKGLGGLETNQTVKSINSFPPGGDKDRLPHIFQLIYGKK